MGSDLRVASNTNAAATASAFGPSRVLKGSSSAAYSHTLHSSSAARVIEPTHAFNNHAPVGESVMAPIEDNGDTVSLNKHRRSINIINLIGYDESTDNESGEGGEDDVPSTRRRRLDISAQHVTDL